MPEGRVLSRYRAIVTGDDSLVGDLSPYFNTKPQQHPVYLLPFPEPPRRVPGRLGVLAARGDGNYCHFLFDVVPKLAILERCRVVLPDQWYAPMTSGFQRELLDAFGVDRERVIDSAEFDHVQAEQLVVPTLPDPNLRAPEWMVRWLRERLLPSDVAVVPGRRLFVTRGSRPHSRIITNEFDVQRMLVDRGFETIDCGALSVAQQVRLFAEAELVVAPHGAALSNLVFASPGASVVELFAPDYVFLCFWMLANRIDGLTYNYLVGEGNPPKWRERMMKGVTSDITVDVQKLARLVDGLASPRE